MKGEPNMKESKRQKMTLLLDDETIKLLKKYGYETLGETNVSKAVMSMVKKYGTQTTKDTESI